MEPEPHTQHTLLRDIILGGQDGLVNVLGIILGVGVASGGVNKKRSEKLEFAAAKEYTQSPHSDEENHTHLWTCCRKFTGLRPFPLGWENLWLAYGWKRRWHWFLNIVLHHLLAFPLGGDILHNSASNQYQNKNNKYPQNNAHSLGDFPFWLHLRFHAGKYTKGC